MKRLPVITATIRASNRTLSNISRLQNVSSAEKQSNLVNDGATSTIMTNDQLGERNFWAPAYSDLGALCTVTGICAIIVIIVFGNTLTIVAVFKERRLHQVQNWFIVSLACADLLVGLIVMPLALTYEVLGRWTLGPIVCEIWLAFDVLFVTSSILNICIISLDRYWSVTDPINYVRKRTKRRVLAMCALAWIIALLISFPPLVGWRPDRSDPTTCDLSTQIDYVLYSACGSFYVPSLILVAAYFKIYMVTRARAKKLSQSCATVGKDPPTWAANGVVSPELPSMYNNEKMVADDNELTLDVDPNSSSRSTDHEVDVNGCLNGSGSERLGSAEVNQALLTCVKADVRRISSESATGGHASSVEPDCSSVDSSRPGHLFGVNYAHKTSKVLQQVNVLTYLVRSETPVPMHRKKTIANRRQLVRKREIRATAILGCILFGFILSWLPFFIIYVLGAICCSASELVFDVFFWLGYCNSALNPIIYAVVNVEFRRAFQRILCMKRKQLSRQ